MGTKEAAAFAGVSLSTLRRAVKAGELPASRHNQRLTLLARCDVEEWKLSRLAGDDRRAATVADVRRIVREEMERALARVVSVTTILTTQDHCVGHGAMDDSGHAAAS
ncbi:MAG: helix-turn-helix domain-containing protein [Opitutaceae bacterium]